MKDVSALQKDTCDWQARHGRCCPPSGGVFLQGTVWGPALYDLIQRILIKCLLVCSAFHECCGKGEMKKVGGWVGGLSPFKDWSRETECNHLSARFWAKSLCALSCFICVMAYHVASIISIHDQQITVPKVKAGSLPKVTQLSGRAGLQTTFRSEFQSLSLSPSSHSSKCLRSYWEQPQMMWVLRVPGRGRKKMIYKEKLSLYRIASCRWTEHKEEGSPTFPLLQDSSLRSKHGLYVMKLINVILQNPAQRNVFINITDPKTDWHRISQDIVEGHWRDRLVRMKGWNSDVLCP